MTSKELRNQIEQWQSLKEGATPEELKLIAEEINWLLYLVRCNAPFIDTRPRHINGSLAAPCPKLY